LRLFTNLLPEICFYLEGLKAIQREEGFIFVNFDEVPFFYLMREEKNIGIIIPENTNIRATVMSTICSNGSFKPFEVIRISKRLELLYDEGFLVKKIHSIVQDNLTIKEISRKRNKNMRTLKIKNLTKSFANKILF